MKNHVLTTTPGWSGGQCKHKVKDSVSPNCKDNDVCVYKDDTIEWISSNPSQTASVEFKSGRTPCSIGPDGKYTVSVNVDPDPKNNEYPYKLTTRGSDNSVICEEDPKIIVQKMRAPLWPLGLGIAILVGIAIYGLRPRSSDD